METKIQKVKQAFINSGIQPPRRLMPIIVGKDDEPMHLFKTRLRTLLRQRCIINIEYEDEQGVIRKANVLDGQAREENIKIRAALKKQGIDLEVFP